MALDWIDVTDIPFNVVLLFERAQVGLLVESVPRRELATALRANPAVEWYLRHKDPDVAAILDEVMTNADPAATPEQVRAAEESILRRVNDWVLYAVDPARYDALPFLGWDDTELLDLADFAGKTVLDVGAGTGRLAFVAARAGARAVFAVEPVFNLRRYLREKADRLNCRNVFAVDGLLTAIPFPDGFADVTLGGHVFGDEPEAEHAELVRVTRPGGTIILCPGGGDEDGDRHRFLVDRGFQWARFEEPGEGLKRKYWKTLRSSPAGAP